MLLSEMGLTGLRTLDPTSARDSSVMRALEIAHQDIGVREKPRGSNRGARIDHYSQIAGAPLGSYWCASALTTWWKEAGLEVPPLAATWWVQHKLPVSGPAACKAWVHWALLTNRWSHEPKIGAGIIYGVDMKSAEHCGLCVEWDPIDGTHFSIEGNTTLDGYSRNGEVVTLKTVRTARLLGYVYPSPL
jgi:hypothetical protein